MYIGDEQIDPAYGNWLAGFADGEGSFLIARTVGSNGNEHYAPRFVIRLRADDGDALLEIQNRIGVGQVAPFYPPALREQGRTPQVALQVSNQGDCLKLVRIFDQHPLRAKKAKDYAIWREAVLESHSDVKSLDRLRQLKQRLEAGRKFEAEDIDIEDEPPHPNLFEAVAA